MSESIHRLITPVLSVLLLLVALLTGSAARVAAQTKASSRPRGAQSVEDPHSFARPNEASVKHLTLDLSVNFAKQTIDGKATLLLDNRTGTRELHLDTRDLEIEKVTLGADEKPAQF